MCKPSVSNYLAVLVSQDVPFFRDMIILLLFSVKKKPELTVSSVVKSAYDPILVLIMVPGISGSTIPKNPFSISAKDVQDCA